MDIKKRINARKIVLSALYQHCFFSAMQKNIKPDPVKQEASTDGALPADQGWFLDSDFLKQVAAKKKLDEHIDEYVQAQITQYAMDQDIESDFSYFLPHFFDQWSADEVDAEYVLQIGNGVARYEKELIDQVNQYTQSFQYEQMDIIDQACLLLWYLEYQILHTPKELVINEMVELAKRYSDDGAPKLVNGILHSIFHALETNQ